MEVDIFLTAVFHFPKLESTFFEAINPVFVSESP